MRLRRSSLWLKGVLEQKSSFINYAIMEDLAEFLQLVDAQKIWREYTKFRNGVYREILGEHFAVAAIDEHIKDRETKVCLYCESLVMK